ncbi:MAG: CHASE2 domain-containing protein, partial [Pseudomonadota bacterium]
MRRRLDRLALSIGLLVMAGLFLLFETRPAQISAVEEAIFDQYQRWQPRPYNPESPVRVIDIDEASLSALGQWPWPRTFLAELIVRVANAGAAAIAFDMTFAEPDRTSPAILVPSLQRFGDDYSAVFADPGVKRGTGVVP